MGHRVTKGFSLVELMVVVAITGIIAVFAIPAYGNYIKRVELAELVELSQGTQFAVTEFFHENGRFPSTWDEIDLKIPFEINAIPESNPSVEWKEITGNEVVYGRLTLSLDMKYGIGATPSFFLIATPSKASGVIEWTCKFNNIDSSYNPGSCETK